MISPLKYLFQRAGKPTKGLETDWLVISWCQFKTYTLTQPQNTISVPNTFYQPQNLKSQTHSRRLEMDRLGLESIKIGWVPPGYS